MTRGAEAHEEDTKKKTLKEKAYCSFTSAAKDQRLEKTLKNTREWEGTVQEKRRNACLRTPNDREVQKGLKGVNDLRQKGGCKGEKRELKGEEEQFFLKNRYLDDGADSL